MKIIVFKTLSCPELYICIYVIYIYIYIYIHIYIYIYMYIYICIYIYIYMYIYNIKKKIHSKRFRVTPWSSGVLHRGIYVESIYELGLIMIIVIIVIIRVLRVL